MAAVAPQHRQQPHSYNSHVNRHHPYSHPVQRSTPVQSAQEQKYRQQQRLGRDSTLLGHGLNGTSDVEMRDVSPNRVALPPSPPRSRRDGSESSSIGLSLAFGGTSGGKWWDEELPAPPAPLSSILDSFRRSGEGDRELLLSILGAKKAEEERLTALIQTRLTILQARLSLHSAAAAISSAPAAAFSPNSMPPPSAPSTSPKLSNSGRPSPPLSTTGLTRPPSPPNTNGYLPPTARSPLPSLTRSLSGESSKTYQLPPLHSSSSSKPSNERATSPPKERRQLAPMWFQDRSKKSDSASNAEPETISPTSTSTPQLQRSTDLVIDANSKVSSKTGDRLPSPTGSARSERSGSGLDILCDGISRGSTGSLVRESAERGSSE